MKLESLLRRVKQTISSPKNWAKGAFAKASPSSPIALAVNDPRATCYCLAGAIRLVNGSSVASHYREHRALLVLRDLASLNMPNILTVVDFNDNTHTTHAEVLALCDDAILYCKEAGI